jgi:hypothetical protein
MSSHHHIEMLHKIVSGGQTGADRAALDAALEAGVDVGGWVPRGRVAEDGIIPWRYPGLHEAESADPAIRTALNVQHSDATLIVSRGPLAGGSRLTLEEAHRRRKPVLHVDLSVLSSAEAVAAVRAWLAEARPAVLNVAGPRASEDRELGGLVFALIRQLLTEGP